MSDGGMNTTLSAPRTRRRLATAALYAALTASALVSLLCVGVLVYLLAAL